MRILLSLLAYRHSSEDFCLTCGLWSGLLAASGALRSKATLAALATGQSLFCSIPINFTTQLLSLTCVCVCVFHLRVSGGLGYFYDEEGDFCDKVNTEIVAIQRVVTPAGAAQLKELIQVRGLSSVMTCIEHVRVYAFDVSACCVRRLLKWLVIFS